MSDKEISLSVAGVDDILGTARDMLNASGADPRDVEAMSITLTLADEDEGGGDGGGEVPDGDEVAGTQRVEKERYELDPPPLDTVVEPDVERDPPQPGTRVEEAILTLADYLEDTDESFATGNDLAAAGHPDAGKHLSRGFVARGMLRRKRIRKEDSGGIQYAYGLSGADWGFVRERRGDD